MPLIIDSQIHIINSLSSSTLSSYWTAWNHFHNFHDKHNIPFPSLDLTTVVCFINHAHSVLNIKTRTIKSYISGISFFSKLLTGHPSPAFSHPQVTSLFKGLLRQEPERTPRRLPLTTDLLLICINNLRSGYNTPHVALTLQAMFTLAFFGFLRCSEFTASSSNFIPFRHACISDLSLYSNNIMVFYLKKSKTNQSGQPTPIFYFKNLSPLDPFLTLSNYLNYRKSNCSSLSDPLFISESGQVATRFWFHHHLRQILIQSGISPTHYSGHSFRIGAATSASRNGIPEHTIQIMGRWTSLTYHRYIRSDLSDLRAAQALLY